jgi:NAD(P)-dependent dehydrogenase (short-subunit alcohol dehydrogenase family)
VSQSATSQYSRLFDLTGKTALVTGGAGLLGSQFCAALAAHGANVAVVDLRQADADRVAAEIGGECTGFACDVADPRSVAQLVADVVSRFGAIHVLHNNAATKSEDLEAFFAPFETYSLSEWRKIMAVNLDGMFLVAQAVGAQMVRQKSGGSIIQTSSIYGVVAPDQRIYEGSEYLGRAINTPAVYAASKAGVIGLSRYLATYWAAEGIRVNTLTPGGVESGQNDTFRSRYAARVPLGRMAERGEMVGALLYLASDASRYVTGQNLVVDGGLTCW